MWQMCWCIPREVYFRGVLLGSVEEREKAVLHANVG
jgi:hypothetical protein